MAQGKASPIPTFDMLQLQQNQRFGLSDSTLFNDAAVAKQWGEDCSVHKNARGEVAGVSSTAYNENNTARDFMVLSEGMALTPDKMKEISENMRVVTESGAGVVGGFLKDFIPEDR